MTFLNAALLAGSLAFAIPIIIHLFHKSRFKIVPWGAMHLLEAVILSDRVLVMSARPGCIIDEIAIEIGGRDDPLRRRKDGKIAGYMARLMEQLEIVRPASVEGAPRSA